MAQNPLALRMFGIGLVAITVSCSGTADGGASNTGGSSAGGSSHGGTSNGDDCPNDAPVQGSDCTAPAGNGFVRAHCSWGDDPRPACRTTALCSQGEWQVTEPTATYCEESPLPAACPTSPPMPGDACADETLQCWYADGMRCWCSGCMGGSEYPICQTISPPEWACSTPPAECPNPLPQAGEPCDNQGLSCGPNCEEPIQCRDGAWQYDQGACPICASPVTPIATPVGEKPIALLQEGDLVYSVDGDAIVVVPLLRVASTPVIGHQVMRVLLDNGATLELSPGHPTADGRRFSELTMGAHLDERHVVLGSDLVPYSYERTYDILPASSTGAYFAGGALVGSSLRSR